MGLGLITSAIVLLETNQGLVVSESLSTQIKLFIELFWGQKSRLTRLSIIRRKETLSKSELLSVRVGADIISRNAKTLVGGYYFLLTTK